MSRLSRPPGRVHCRILAMEFLQVTELKGFKGAVQKMAGVYFATLRLLQKHGPLRRRNHGSKMSSARQPAPGDDYTPPDCRQSHARDPFDNLRFPTPSRQPPGDVISTGTARKNLRGTHQQKNPSCLFPFFISIPYPFFVQFLSISPYCANNWTLATYNRHHIGITDKTAFNRPEPLPFAHFTIFPLHERRTSRRQLKL